jgi:hypothetical protein
MCRGDQHNSALQNQTTSPLLRLPPEIRNRIYDFTLDLKSGRIQHDDHYDWDRLELSRTCRQIYAETAADYFDLKILPLHLCEIVIPNIRELEATIEKFAPTQKGAITKVSITWVHHVTAGRNSLRPLVQLPHLKAFKVCESLLRSTYSGQPWVKLIQKCTPGKNIKIVFSAGRDESFILA